MKLKVGDKVKLNEKIKEFEFGKGPVKYGEVGIIKEIYKDKIQVNFPSMGFITWDGLKSEVKKVVDQKHFKSLPSDYTGTIEVENGFIQEKELLDEAEKEYLSNVIRPFRSKVKYIVKGRIFGDYIGIKIENDGPILFPFFKTGTMYKGMELNKKYSLEELGL